MSQTTEGHRFELSSSVEFSYGSEREGPDPDKWSDRWTAGPDRQLGRQPGGKALEELEILCLLVLGVPTGRSNTGQ